MPGTTAGKYATPDSFGHHPALYLNGVNQFLQTLTLRVEHPSTELRQPVVAPARVVQFRRGPFVRFLDEFRLDQPLNRSIQRGWPQPDFSARALQDFIHDAVAVLLSPGKREHDVKPLCLQRKKRLRVNISHIRYVYISISISSREQLRSGSPHRHRESGWAPVWRLSLPSDCER